MGSQIKKLQQAFQTKTKKTFIFCMAFVISLSGLSVFSPKNGTYADPNLPNPDDYATIEIGGGATSISEADGDDELVTVIFQNGIIDVSGTNLYSNTTLTERNTYEIYALGDVTITATPNANYQADLLENGEHLNSTTVEYTGLAAGDHRRLDGDFSEANPNPPAPDSDYEDIAFDLSWTNTFVNVWINNGQSVVPESQDFTSTSFTYNNVVVENAGTTDPEDTNTIRLQTRFGDLIVTEFVINNQSYTAEDDNVVIDEDGSWYITVPGASKYVISGTGNEGITPPRTIIWANVDADHDAENFEEDMLLEHGRAKVVAVYDEDGHQVAGESDVDETGMGWVQVVPGHMVVFEFIPEYGYQLTSVSANGIPLEPQDTINQYTFEMPNTNIHFAATFERVEDVVKANSEKITSGTITLGGALDGGSAQLTVSDIELSEDKIVDFKNAAEGYEIASYLDIDLYNIYYKGKDDAEDIWSDKIDELEEAATITIKLAEGIDADSIVIVHNVHDGEEYEIIKIDSYDPETNTITFKTKSFSNYAIATRDTEAAVPDTGVMTSGDSSAVVALAGVMVSFVLVVTLFAAFKRSHRR